MTISNLITHVESNRVVELNIAIIVCSVPGLAKFFRTYVVTWTPVQSLRSKLSKLRGSSTRGSHPPQQHAGWPAAQPPPAPKSLSDEEAGMTQTTSVSSHDNEVDRTQAHVEMRDRWQVESNLSARDPNISVATSQMSGVDPELVDPYLDTAGPEFSWLHRKSKKNNVSGGISQDHT